MKLEPRTRNKATLFELDSDSNYTILFRRKGSSSTPRAARKASASKAKAETSHPSGMPKLANPSKNIVTENSIETMLPILQTEKSFTMENDIHWQWRTQTKIEWINFDDSRNASIERLYRLWLRDSETACSMYVLGITMKLEPRTRTKAALFELDRDSNYLLLFRNASNAHLYAKSKQVKKATLPKAKEHTISSQIIPPQRPAMCQRKQTTLVQLSADLNPSNTTTTQLLSSGTEIKNQVVWRRRQSSLSDWIHLFDSEMESPYQKWLCEGKPPLSGPSLLPNFHEMKFGACEMQRVEITPVPPPDNLVLKDGVWQWKFSTSAWIDYCPSYSTSIETAYRQWVDEGKRDHLAEKSGFFDNKHPFTVEFNTMKLDGLADVRRIVITSTYWYRDKETCRRFPHEKQ